MYYMISLESQIDKLLDDCHLMLRDMSYYDEVPSSTYFQTYINQKMRQLEGLKLLLEDDRGESNISEAKKIFDGIKDQIYVISKRWKLAAESKYSKQKTRLGKLFFLSSVK